MVKADVRRDYYADLGLTPSAELEDIKKQFRKLALKYHPDRNPGKELEFISKFQAIQAAHEILSDPQQRLRYDTDRLRAGYGKLYGPPKPNTSRKTPTSSPSAKPTSAKQPFSRPQSYHAGGGGPSSGAQRYASYARAAPKQPWEKMNDEGQSGADAYRGFQHMKSNGMPGWSHFDPRTGRSAYPGAKPRASAFANDQSTRPKSAYEYFKAAPKPSPSDNARASNFAKKRQGFTPHAAGGDEPMASSTSSYSNANRGDRSSFFGPAPSPTARKAAAGFGNRAQNSAAPEFERTRSQYANVGGEKMFFSSAGLGRSPSGRTSPEGSPKSQSRTNPPSPVPQHSGRHRSASPNLKTTDRSRNYSSTSSSDSEDELNARKPKAVPKSRLRPHQKFSDFHTQQQWRSGPGHDSDSAASPLNAFGASSFFKAGNPFDATQGSTTNGPQNRAFKSSSHDDLHKPFSANYWGDKPFFTGTSSDTNGSQAVNGRGRTTNRNAPGQGVNPTSASDNSSPQPGSAPQQKPTPFAEGKFFADDWFAKFNMNRSWAMPTSEEPQQQQPGSGSSPQRQKSPRKNTRTAAATRPTPQPASVATEAEEAQATFNGDKAEAVGGEAMDIDDDLPKTSGATPEPTKAAKDQSDMPPPRSRPTSSAGAQGANTKDRSFNLQNLGKTAPFTSSNSGGIEDLQDIHATLPFESRAKVPQSSVHDIRPRNLVCPNPPKRPPAPTLVPISLGSDQLGLRRTDWDRYVAEMSTYMREWNAFNKRILRHFNARQEAIETGMAPNWIGAVGDSARLHVNEDDGAAEPNKRDNGEESDDDMVAGSGKGGISAYLRGLEEDAKVQKHWEVAREMHRDCILKLGETREWILKGGKLI